MTLAVPIVYPDPIVYITNTLTWLTPLFTLLAGIAGALIAGRFLMRAEDRRVYEARRVTREARIEEVVVDLLTIGDRRLAAVMTGEWTVTDESELWSAVTRVSVLAPEHLGDMAIAVGDSFHGLSDIKGFKDRLSAYDDHRQQKRVDFLRAARQYFASRDRAPVRQNKFGKSGAKA